MATSFELIEERSDYYAFIEQLTQTGSKIKSAINLVNELKQNTDESYKIDDESGDSRVLEKELNSLNNMVHNIYDIMLPSLNNRVNVLSRNIQIAEYNERIKAEEAERKREELNNSIN